MLQGASIKSTIYNFYPIIMTLEQNYELVILTKSHNNWMNILDFLLIAYLWPTDKVN